MSDQEVAGLQGPLARHPRREAQAVLGDRFEARVLEPSPPAVIDGEWFADDPVRPEPSPAQRPAVGPVGGADLTWSDWLKDRPEVAPWAAARWLGAFRRLPSPPEGFADTRRGLHRLAVYVISPARRRANTKIGLRWTYGGFGTPFFGADEQVRVDGDRVVRQRAGAADAVQVTTLRRAARFILDGPPDLEWARPFDVPAPGDLDEELGVDQAAASFLGDWYGFSHSVLEELRADHEGSQRRVQLWPEHFDAAFDIPAGDGRAVFGASPGDAAVDEPYLYVLPPDPEALPPGASWSATSFRGAILPFSELVDAADQRAAALAFLRRHRAALRA